MKVYVNFLNQLNIDNDLITTDELMLSLTHKQVLNEEKNNKYFNILDFYYEIGRAAFNLSMKVFIYQNLSKDKASIEIIKNASSHIFLDNFISKYDIEKYMIYKAETLNKKVKVRLTFQMIGIIYIKSSYEHLEKIFKRVFNVSDLVLVDSYLRVLQSFAKDRTIQLIELDSSGLDHKKEFKYKLTLDGKSVISNGVSKAKAKENCAKLYCERYLTKHEIMINTGILRKRGHKNKKKFIKSNELEETLTKLSLQLGIKKDNLMICLTHSSLSNEYDLIDNSNVQGIGADIEHLFLLNKFFIENKNMKMHQVIRIIAHLRSNSEIHKLFMRKYGLKGVPLAVKKIYDNNTSFLSALNDMYNSILFFDFYENNEIPNTFNDLYDLILKDTNVRYLDSTSVVQELVNQLNLNIKYTYVVEKTNFVCKATFEDVNISVEFSEISNSKSMARFLTSQKILKWFYEEIEDFLLNKVSMEHDYLILQKALLFLMNERPLEFTNLIRLNNYFSLNDAIFGDPEVFITNLSNILKVSISKFEDSTLRKLIDFLKYICKSDLIYLNNTDYLLEVVILDLYEYLLETDNEATYSLPKNNEHLKQLSYNSLISLVSNNGLLVKYIKNPNEKLQLAAIKNDPSAIYYLKSPSINVIEYLMMIKDSKDTETLIITKAKEHNELLLSLVSNRYKDFLLKNDKDISFSLLSTDVTFDIHIRSLFKVIDIKKFFVAVGFVYSSGLLLLEKEIEKLLTNNGDFRIIAGNLQNYFSKNHIENMDKKTAIQLNHLMSKGASIKTFNNRFYHGKIYILQGDFQGECLTAVIIGSSNLSKNAFINNIEIDHIIFLKENIQNEYLNRFYSLWENANLISSLDESKFLDKIQYNLNTENTTSLKKLSESNVKEQINIIPDLMLKQRLLLWLEYKPSNIYGDLTVANQDYIAIEYTKKNMIVLESFVHGNSYFVFYDISINELLKEIVGKSKTEIFDLSNMEKRGYHVRELMTLELNIKSYFLY